MRVEDAAEELEEYEVVIFDKKETAESFSISAEIKNEVIGHTFPKSEKWLSEYNGSPGYIWKIRELYNKRFESKNSEDVKLGRY